MHAFVRLCAVNKIYLILRHTPPTQLATPIDLQLYICTGRICKNEKWSQLLKRVITVLLLGKTPMQVELGIRPLTPMDLVFAVTTAKAEKVNSIKNVGKVSDAENRIAEITAVRESIAEDIATVQADQKKYADDRRRICDQLIKPGAKASWISQTCEGFQRITHSALERVDRNG